MVEDLKPSFLTTIFFLNIFLLYNFSKYKAIEQLKFLYTICLRKFLNNLLFYSRVLIHGDLSGGREIRRVVMYL